MDRLRLREVGGLSRRAIARSLKTSPTTIGEYLRRADAARLSLEEAEAELERRLYPNEVRKAPERPQPDWARGPCHPTASA